MHTPEQVAQSVIPYDGSKPTDRAPMTWQELEAITADAVVADRAQRDLYELIAEALDDRTDWDDGDGEKARLAAERIRSGTEVDIWDRFIGPKIDDLMKHLGQSGDPASVDPCVQAGEHQFRAEHRSEACPVHQGVNNSGECERCGQDAPTRNADDQCPACAALPECDECNTREGDLDQQGQPIELNRWPDLVPPVQLCPSCTHNARRSGWEPGR